MTLLMCGFCGASFAQQGVTMTLDGRTAAVSGADTTTRSDELIGGRSVVRLGNVQEATVTWFPAPRATAGADTPAVLVLPGGGYRVLATDLEGTEVAAWLNSQGISALLLRYRVPTAPPHAEPLSDARAALQLLIKNAALWHIDARHVGVMGFSAGAHLAGRLTALAPAHSLSAMLLIYPAYFRGDSPDTEGVSFKSTTPPTLVVQAEDDPVQVENATGIFAQLNKLKVPAELHIFASGGHGYGLRRTGAPTDGWPALAAAWFAHQGFASQAEGGRP